MEFVEFVVLDDAMKVEIDAEMLRFIRDELWIEYMSRNSSDVDPSGFNAKDHVRAIDEALSKVAGLGN